MAIGVHHVYLGDEDLGIFDENQFKLSDAFIIKSSSGLNVASFIQGISTRDPLVLQTFVWWLKHRKGENVDRPSIDFNIADLRMVDEPDPTQATTSGSVVADISDS